MNTEDVKRKLSAILSADVQGYSRLMGDDERATVETITAYRRIMTDLIESHHGKVADAKGDNVLAEFSSVVDAIQCAVEIQKELKVKNAGLPENRRMAFRIGVNLGDVIEKGDTIYGDGVNIAARLESLAEGGGICISGTAFDQIGKKVPLGYKYLGEQTVKNFEKPIRTYKVLAEPEAVGMLIGENRRLKMWQWTVIFGLMVLIVVAGTLAFWEFYVRPDVAPASVDRMAFPLPDRPSIAVLPFVNMSEDPKQELLCDGMTEEIITALTKVRDLFVISRQSTFTYKGKPVKVKQVSEELGVRYVMEGSFRRSGDRVRVTVQLVDALRGNHLWAERYDRDLKDIFALYDEITMKILTVIRVKLTEGQDAFAQKGIEKYYKGKQGLECYLKIMEGNCYLQSWNIEANNLARQMIEEAIAMCPENPMGYTSLGWVYHHDFALGNTKFPRETLEKGIELAQKALAMNDSLSSAHALLSALYRAKLDIDKAIAEGERAVALNPSGTPALVNYASSLSMAGRPEEAIPLYQKATRLNPLGRSYLYREFGAALSKTGRFEEAVSRLKKAIQLAPDDLYAHIFLAITYSRMGREEEARTEGTEVLRIDPNFSVDSFLRFVPYPRLDETINALRKAGLK
jgi:adenylate cyclase